MCSTEETLHEPGYDTETYIGRVLRHLQLRNPFNLLACTNTLEEGRCLYLQYKCGQNLPDTVTQGDLERSKAMFESSYDTATGKMIHIGARPASQVFANGLLAGGMMAFYKSIPGNIIWHWLNQSYNTFVRQDRKGGEDDFTDQQLTTSYIAGTGTAIATAIGLSKICKCGVVSKFVPLVAVAAAHGVSIPILRAQNLKNGVAVYDDADNKVAHSKTAAQSRITDETAANILNAVPPLVLSPLLVKQFLETRGTLFCYPWLNFPAHAAFAMLCLLLFSPLTYAILSDKAALPYRHLEPELREFLCKKFSDRPPKYVFYDRTL